MKRTVEDHENDEDNEDTQVSSKMKETDQVPPYIEGEYTLDNDTDIYSIEHLEKIVKYRNTLIEQVVKINEYAEIYCNHPTDNNKVNTKNHLSAYARACSYYGQKNAIHEEMKDIIKNTHIEEAEPGWEELWRFTSDFGDGNYQDDADDPELTRIASDCSFLLKTLYYVESKQNPPYPRVPPLPLDKFPLSPIEGYLSDLPSGEIVDMLLAFTMHALEPPFLFEMVAENRDKITIAFDAIRERNSRNIFHFNLDPFILKELLKTSISNAEGVVMYIIHAFQMFIVYGNFIIDETDNFVKGINPEQMVNQSELASTAYLYFSIHGGINIQRGTYPKSMRSTKKISKDVKHVTVDMPPGSRIFIQKQAEPMGITYKGIFLKTYERGTLSNESGICALKCKQKDSSLCNCYDFFGNEVPVETLTRAVNDELRKNKIPSAAYIGQLYNRCTEDLQNPIKHPGGMNVDPIRYLYRPGNLQIRDELKKSDKDISRDREFIGRIPLHTNKYINKYFLSDPEKGFYGIYDLLNGNLISANDDFTDYISDQPDGWVKPLYKIRKHSTDPFEEIPDSPYYMTQASFTTVIHYFTGMGYKNIFLFDFSCENPLQKLNKNQLAPYSNTIGTKGYGMKKRQRKRRKTRKNSRRSRRANRKSLKHRR